VQEFENLVWIKKGNFVYFLYLGDAYMGVKDFQNAFNNYKTAEVTLIQASILASEDPARYAAMPDSVPVNAELLSHCYSRQADAKIKLFEGKDALTLLRKAYDYTSDSNRKLMLSNLIDLVNWDDGNVLAMNLRQQANEHIKMGDYKSASAILQQLLNVLWTHRTKDEINNQIAMLDFQHLDRKEAGIERMRLVVTPMQKDSVGAPIKPVNQLYFMNYGRMCYDFGLRFLTQEDDRKTAYIYFFQATKMQWYGRPKAFLQLAALSEFDPRETIRLGFTALKEAENLSPSEKRQVAELLSNAFQKEAKFKEARTWYRMSLDRTWCENQDQS
jgi:tetratricopeptide (TPR) repeat protein